VTTTGTAFDLADLELLLTRYDTPTSAERPRRPPWTWTALERHERAALGRVPWITEQGKDPILGALSTQ
jgi:hypothetical protein